MKRGNPRNVGSTAWLDCRYESQWLRISATHACLAAAAAAPASLSDRSTLVADGVSSLTFELLTGTGMATAMGIRTSLLSSASKVDEETSDVSSSLAGLFLIVIA